MDNDTLVDVSVLQKRYGEKVAIDGFDLALIKGEIYGLLGANGGGKTTCLRMLAGLLQPDGGFGSVLGYGLGSNDKCAFEYMRHRIGYMAQKHSLYDTLTVCENLKFRAEIYGLQNITEAVESVLETFDLKAFFQKKAKELSGGWARRLQLAAALIHKPDLVLLDEPTTGLDAHAKAEVWHYIGKLASMGVGVIVSTHDLMEAQRCNRASFFVDGSVVASGSVDEIINQSLVTRVTFLSTSYDQYFPELNGCPCVLSIIQKKEGACIALPSANLPDVVALAESKGISIQMQSPTIEDAARALVRGWATERGAYDV